MRLSPVDEGRKMLFKRTIVAVGKPLGEAFSISISSRKRLAAWRTPLFANSLFLMTNSAVSAVLTFVFWIIAARLFPSTAVGLASALISAATLLAFVASLGLGTGLVRFMPGAGSGAVGLINSCLTISSIAAVVAAVTFLAGLPLWSPALLFVREHPVSIVAFVAFVTAATLLSLLDQAFIGLRRAEFTLAQNSLQSLVKIALLVAMAGFFSVFGIFFSWGVALAAAVGLGLLVFLPRLQPGYRLFPALRRQVSNEMLHFSFANYVSTGSWSAPSWLLPIMVVNLLGGEANAHFFVSWGMASLIFAIPTAISMSLFAEGSYDDSFLARDVRRGLKLAAVSLLPALAVILSMGDKLLFLFGREYSSEGTKVLWVVTASAVPATVTMMYLGIARVNKRLKDITLLPVTVALGTIILGYVLIPPLGILGPGVGWLVSQSLAALVVLRSVVRMLR